MSGTISIDMHNHVYPAGTEPHPQRGQPRRQEEQQQAPGLSLAEELKESGLAAVCASFVLDFAANEKTGDARDNFLRWLTAIDAELEKGHIRRALKLKVCRPPMTMVHQQSSKRSKGHTSSRGPWTGYKRCTNAVFGTFSCFTIEATWCRPWATQIRGALTSVV